MYTFATIYKYLLIRLKNHLSANLRWNYVELSFLWYLLSQLPVYIFLESTQASCFQRWQAT